MLSWDQQSGNDSHIQINVEQIKKYEMIINRDIYLKSLTDVLYFMALINKLLDIIYI